MAKNTTRFDSITTMLNRCFDIENKRLDFSTSKINKKDQYSIQQILNYCFDPDNNTLDIKGITTADQTDESQAIAYAIVFGG